jgi:hypothetical protein
MQVIKESHIELHSANTVLPYNMVDEGEVFGLFTIKLNKIPIRKCPFHFVFMIDATLSMSETDKTGKTKMEYMQRTLIKMLEYLFDVDSDIYVTIHTFNIKVDLLIDDVLLTELSVKNISDLINKLKPDNITNIQKALEMSNKELDNIQNKYPERQCCHIFMTDGYANVGATSPETLANLINQKFPNVFIGFGKEHNSVMLNRFAECKNSEYYFVDNLENSVLVYAESIHNILYSAYSNVKFRIRNGEFYDFKTDRWTNVLYENNLSSECHKFYQLKTNYPNEVNITIVECADSETDNDNNTLLDTVVPLPDLCDENNIVLLTDLTHYAFRNKVQSLLFLAKNSINEIDNELSPEDLVKELKDVFKTIKSYMKENNIMDNSFLKMLCDDIYVTVKSFDIGLNIDMYVGARQTSQGRQRSYNIGTEVEDTIDYNDIPVLRRQTNNPLDFDNYGLERSTTTCYATPSMMNTFREVSHFA